ncbi:MAG: nucleotide exchange factor GrpE [Clostridia bacterium]|nr:nucleotide exchange factor GrpE [Clostridia bacterium]
MAKKHDEDKEHCKCGCGENLKDEHDYTADIFEDNTTQDCGCGSDCDCGDDCNCTKENKCNENCTCGDDCDCKGADYLKDFQRVQAEFDNYRKRMQTSLLEARQDGFMEAIEKFIPALDSFKMATEYIQDKNTLMGIQYIEKGILDTLSKMGVEVIDATGKFDPNLHLAIEAEDKEGFESGDIIKECYKGFKYKDRVIRYSQVIVQK